jgi:hypothetical protein
MDEHRQRQRQRILKAGTISFDHAGIDCTVRNVSDTGACLEIESPVGIPNNFTLVISKDNLKRPCHVAWRSGRRIGAQNGQGKSRCRSPPAHRSSPAKPQAKSAATTRALAAPAKSSKNAAAKPPEPATQSPRPSPDAYPYRNYVWTCDKALTR